MDITNIGALVLLLARIITVLIIAIFVLPITIRELTRKQHLKALYALRWTLFITCVLYILPSVFPIWNGFVRLNQEPISVLSQIASYWQAVREVSIGLMIVLMFYFAKILSKIKE